METNESPQAGGNNGFLTPAQIKGIIGLMLTKEFGNYLTALNQLKTIFIGEDNIEEVQQVMKKVNSFISSVENHRKDMKDPFFRYGQLIDTTHKEFITPFVEEKEKVQVKLNAVAKAVADKVAKENAAKQKQLDISASINQFILENSVKIASATTNEQLLSIERLINLEKANKSKYDVQLPLLIERCNELTDKIKDQKDLIKQKGALDKAKKEAEQAGDDQKLSELEEQSSQIDSQITDNTILVQEMASNSMMVPEGTDDSLTDGPRARRTAWKAEIHDEKEAVKKSKDLLDISLNAEKIRQSINTLKSAGVFIGKKEVIINGIRYFEEKTF